MVYKTIQSTGIAKVQAKSTNEDYFRGEPTPAERGSKDVKIAEMARSMVNDRYFISKNANSPNFADEMKDMLKPENFKPVLEEVLSIAKDYGQNPGKQITKEDEALLLNFRVNLNAILNNEGLREMLVECSKENTELYDLIKSVNSDPAVKLGFDRVTPLVKEEEKFRGKPGALWDLRSFLV